jgi:hypothetical protein
MSSDRDNAAPEQIETALISAIRRRKRRRQTRALAGVACAATVLGVVVLLANPLGGGPERALAITRDSEWVTLTISDPEASDERMNAELAAAGIDRVRVVSLPASPELSGRFAGYVDMGLDCEGGPLFFGTGISIPDEEATTAVNERGVEVDIPRDSGALTVAPVEVPHGGPTARVRTETVTDPNYSAELLIALRPSEDTDSAGVGVDDLASVGGEFSRFAEALDDQRTTCEEFGTSPRSREDVLSEWPDDAPVPPPVPENGLSLP